MEQDLLPFRYSPEEISRYMLEAFGVSNLDGSGYSLPRDSEYNSKEGIEFVFNGLASVCDEGEETPSSRQQNMIRGIVLIVSSFGDAVDSDLKRLLLYRGLNYVLIQWYKQILDNLLYQQLFDSSPPSEEEIAEGAATKEAALRCKSMLNQRGSNPRISTK